LAVLRLAGFVTAAVKIAAILVIGIATWVLALDGGIRFYAPQQISSPIIYDDDQEESMLRYHPSDLAGLYNGAPPPFDD
jgi:hypothetical protein